MHKPYNTEKTLIVNTHANLLASTTVYGPDFELSPSDTADAGKHKICNGVNTYAELPFIEDAVVGSPTWGSIGGTLTNQADLVTALGAKQSFRLELGAVHSLGTATASAATLDLTPGTVGGDTVPITGTTTITSLGSGCPLGTIRRLVFDDVLVLTNSTDLILPGGVDYTTTAGDALVFVCIDEAGGKWRCVGVGKASGDRVMSIRTIGSGSVTSALTDQIVYMDEANGDTTWNDAGDFPLGWSVIFKMVVGGVGTLTIAAADIDGAATRVLNAGETTKITSVGGGIWIVTA